MTEESWTSCVDPLRMLEFLGSRISDRKARLFLCACLRRARSLLTPGYLQAVEYSENFADGKIKIEELTRKRSEVARRASRFFRKYRALPWSRPVQRQFARMGVLQVASSPLEDILTLSRECWVTARSSSEAEGKRRLELHARCDLLRDLFENPFLPLTISSSVFTWHNGTIVRLAKAAYDNRSLPTGLLENVRLAVLADALEEAGCSDEQILTHLRCGGEHYRGCFVVDALLGKS